MGQLLSEPVTEKTSHEGNDKFVMYGASSMQGWRVHMEDAHAAIPYNATTNASYFAVFDGHGGSYAAKYSSENHHKKIFESNAYKANRICEALRRANFAIDEDLRHDEAYANDCSGCTAIVAVLTSKNVLYVSNAGDSRAVISTSNGKAIPLSHDHKPTNATESARIRNAGSYVEFGRVNGSLALSRALGDLGFKDNNQLPPEKQAVTADPEISEHELTDNDEFMILACDGIWDCLTNQEAVDCVRFKLTERKQLKTICEEMMDLCLTKKSDATGIGCDNMTMIIVAFLRKRSMDAWYDCMAQKEVTMPKCQSPVQGEPDFKKPRVDDRVPPALDDDTNISGKST
ncbi:phosphatase 2C-like domain-containing protein [Radiomyces spectabilis]|uniref:phosphatase 2C-like domain-containing protein n=1 Tax=Radiomyces spectabilis TaxID=64574 RepID=UPI002220D1C0|nr:phosphatase 2C-like domain-containing protein [Radiomyces spectabilis]KAI8368185.1 phosphatase 2C-like domain-containing protein [Radiomyces spectabilis]